MASKRRPALVLSNETVNGTGDVFLMQVTSKSKRDGLSFLLENRFLSSPLPLTSFVRLHKVFTLDQKLIVAKLTSLEKSKFNEVIEAFIGLIKKG